MELTEALRSPYMKGQSNLGKGLIALRDTVLKTAKCVPVMRPPLESLLHGITAHIVVVSTWVELLNYEKRLRKKAASHLYCSNNMLSTAEIRATTFAENMKYMLLFADVKNIRDITLMFVPVLHEDHYYCVCFNLTDNKIEVLDNSASNVTFEGTYNGWLEKLVHYFSINYKAMHL
ncbi:putative papain-like cysteine peptidase superfamily [Helianthus anomalus]